jgi:hypothetical protein
LLLFFVEPEVASELVEGAELVVHLELDALAGAWLRCLPTVRNLEHPVGYPETSIDGTWGEVSYGVSRGSLDS